MLYVVFNYISKSHLWAPIYLYEISTWILHKQRKLSNNKIKFIFPNILFFQVVPIPVHDLSSHHDAGGGFKTCL